MLRLDQKLNTKTESQTIMNRKQVLFIMLLAPSLSTIAMLPKNPDEKPMSHDVSSNRSYLSRALALAVIPKNDSSCGIRTIVGGGCTEITPFYTSIIKPVIIGTVMLYSFIKPTQKPKE